MDLAERLKDARIKKGYRSAAAAARAMGVPSPTYSGHENGTTPPPRDKLAQYATAFGTTVDYLLTGKGRPPRKRMVPLVGHVGAGALAHIYAGDQGELDRVEAPDGSNDNTVAVEIRGESLGSFFNQWLVFYDDRREPVTHSMIGKLCVVGLADGRTLIKKLRAGQLPGHWTLESQFEPPIYDAVVEWAAVVKSMVPR